MEDFLSDPENINYGVAVASAVLSYGAHRLKKGKISEMTTSEIHMYLDEDNDDFDPDWSDLPYLKASKWSRERNGNYTEREETGLIE